MTGEQHRYAVIMAGGRGTRLWPVSTEQQPKQFQALGDSRPLISQTYERLLRFVEADHILISTTSGYAQDVRDALPDLVEANLIVEPRRWGKVGGLLLAAHEIAARDPDAVVLVSPSDSSINSVDGFAHSCTSAFGFVEQDPRWSVILGLKPTRPDVSLGYVHAVGATFADPDLLVVRGFKEKPTRSEAQKFLRRGDYFWNSSHYCFAVGTLVEAYARAAAELSTAVRHYRDTGETSGFDSQRSPKHELAPLVEPGWQIALVQCGFRWYDVGTWPALYRARVESGDSAFVTSGHSIDFDSTSGMVVNDSDLTVVTHHLDGLAVVVSDEVVMVTPISALEDDPEMIGAMQKRAAAQRPTEETSS